MKSTHKIVILFVIGVLLASMGIFSAFLAYSELGNVVLIRNRSVTLITKVNNFLSLMKDVETGERGYVITNDVTYLTPYLTAVATVNADLKELLDMQQLAISHRHLEILVPLVNAKLAIVKSLIDLKRDNELTTEIVRAKSAEGKKLMDTIRAEVASYDHIEDALLIQREASFQSKMNYLFMLMVVGSIATLFVACLIAFLIYKEAQQRATNLIHIESEKMLVALQLKNEELIIATASAKEANVAKSDFLSNISHEIRTPMNAIIGMSYLLMNTALTTHQRDYILKIKSASRHLLNIINDVLDFSKIEAGKLVLESTEFELDKVLETIANLIAEKATAKGIELIFDVAKDVPPLLIGDPIRLGQILINLGTNSVKFTDQGEIDILVNLVEQTEKEVVIKFSVRDTGIGMTQEEIAKLFQRFTQADSSTTRKYGGSGLGLVIAKTLTELMDGQIGVTSELGKGSLFWFTVRLGKGIGQRRKLALSTEMRGKRVLVVDDNDNARIVIVTLLTSMGFKVDEVSSGKQAIEAVQNAASDNSHYEILFLDWQMPVMDGIEVARRI
ncbi:ATP-binding protein [Undibacterium sp. RuRC25W]|uniref:ATP-binding protein n=1 Tax=Undibacterium sp. RuRC25W TaxID=3413047 RepID=UPI003BF1E0D0